jgi:hypothetical protein
MTDALLLGFGRQLLPIPAVVWRRALPAVARREARSALAGLSEEHHRVRDFVVREVARTAAPVEPQTIAEALAMPRSRVAAVLDELERGMVFVYREGGEAVVWAYPVTAAETAHELTFADGHRCHAA